MIVILTISGGFKIVTSIEELADVGTTSALNNKLATRVIGSVISSIKH